MSLEKIIHGTRQHLTDCVALLAASSPPNAFIENVVSGMSDRVSLNTRLLVSGLFFAGLGSIIGYGRDISHKVFHITEQTKDIYKQIHDMTYIAVVTAIVNPLIYVAAGSKDVKEMVIATAGSTVMGFMMGGAMGYSIDVYRDLTGYKPSPRVPKKIQNASPFVKNTLAAGLFGVSMGIIGLMYYLTPNKQECITTLTTQIESTQKYSP